jgi:hypothetical protein
MKKLKVLSFILIIIVVCLCVFIGLIYTGKIEINQVTCRCECDSNTLLSAGKLEEIKKGDYNILENYATENFSISLLTNGKVVFDLAREIDNVSGATHMEVLDKNLYILTAKGEVYKYYLGVTKEATLSAEKLEYTNIQKLVKYSTRKSNAGGCDYIVVVDKEDNYKSIQEFCV